MPLRIETDATLRRACGTDGAAWASAYLANRTAFEGDRRHIELTAWFDAAIAEGRHDGLAAVAAPSGRTPLRVHCAATGCRHEWVLIWLPMVAETAAKVMKVAACPLCGNQGATFGGHQ